MESIAALVSGGVDSSVVVHLLCEQGTKPDIFYIRIGMEDEEGYIDCPAEEDIEITRRLIDAGKLLGVRVLDHLVIGAPGSAHGAGFVSIRNLATLKF